MPDSSDQKLNKLAAEKSPYLLQHARNPVNWYPWGEEALAKAKEEDKMLIISVGYAACHWCHVMEHESFEDSTVAAIMNEHFVSVKVDREERPDIDNVYMAACQLSTKGGCGWPLNAFAMPDGRPVWAGTYFPKENWMNVLMNFKDQYQDNRPKLEEYATNLTNGIRQSESVELNTQKSDYTEETLDQWTEEFLSIIDYKKGGRRGAPKFPMPGMFEYLLREYDRSGNVKALEAATVTLDKMADGGIYDHLGGGFARYSVDVDWLVPHFEKMLYDNGQLLSLYAHGYMITKNERYREVIEETIEFLSNEWTSKANGFYSSYDADSEGEEGKYYVWSKEELVTLVDAKFAEAFLDYYNVSAKGNWEHTNILHVQNDLSSVAQKYSLPIEELKNNFRLIREDLYKHRTKRIKPGLDDKILTSWNALVIIGLVDAYRALGDEDYLHLAESNAHFIKENMIRKDGALYRNHKDGESGINAFVEDYAQLIRAWISLYQVTFEENYLELAVSHLLYAKRHFENEETKMFYYNSDLDPELVARKTELSDNVIPGSNSTMAAVLFDLGTYYNNQAWIDQSRQMLQNMLPSVKQGYSHFYYNWCMLYERFNQAPFEVAILGPDCLSKRKELQLNYVPNVLFLGGADEGKLELLTDKLVEGETRIYVCQNKVCKLPVSEPDQALKLLKN